jgi:signal transduction histidine kinase
VIDLSPIKVTEKALMMCASTSSSQSFNDSRLPASNYSVLICLATLNYHTSDLGADLDEIVRLYEQQLGSNQHLSQEVEACLVELKQSQEKLIEQERLAAIGEFTSMIVHEVRNPLTTIEMGLRYAQKILQSDADQQRLALALSESHRLKHLLCEILSYARPQTLQRVRFNIIHLFDELLLQVHELPEASDRHINYVKGTLVLDVIADIDKLKQVFLNLFRNAFEAISPRDTVRCSISQAVESQRICIHIHNGGTPIPPELLPQLTTPFCSTKPSGTGLGLAISKRIILAHGGELAIASSTTGTTVSVYLPGIL